MLPDSTPEIEILMKKLDKNGDCKISQKEFEAVLREQGLKFGKWRAWYAIYRADVDGDHFVRGDVEIPKLLALVKRKYSWILTNP